MGAENYFYVNGYIVPQPWWPNENLISTYADVHAGSDVEFGLANAPGMVPVAINIDDQTGAYCTTMAGWVEDETTGVRLIQVAQGDANYSLLLDPTHVYEAYLVVESRQGYPEFSPAWTDNLVTMTMTITPEPSTCALLTAGAVTLLAYAWRKRRRTA